MLAAWFGNIARVLLPGRGFYIWGGYANLGNYPGPLKAAGLYFSQGIVWDIPFSDYKKKRGDRLGLNWRIPAITGRRTVRHVVFDTNYWKSFIHTRLAVPMGDPGCLSLFGRSAERHRLLSEHVTSEYRVKTQGRGRTVDEWKLRVDGIDNHWLDGLVGTAVAASMQGATLFGTETKAAPRPRIKLSAMQGGRR